MPNYGWLDQKIMLTSKKRQNLTLLLGTTGSLETAPLLPSLLFGGTPYCLPHSMTWKVTVKWKSNRKWTWTKVPWPHRGWDMTVDSKTSVGKWWHTWDTETLLTMKFEKKKCWTWASRICSSISAHISLLVISTWWTLRACFFGLEN